MFGTFWSTARANKENIFYTILTVFLLERVRRGWNRIETRGKAANMPLDEIARRQQSFTFGAALLYALPFLLPAVKYVYRSVDELAQYVHGLGVLSNLWALAIVVIATEALLAIVIYNLLGIYVDRMNGALGFFRKIGRSVVDGSRLAVQNGVQAGVRAGGSVKRGIRSGARVAVSGTLGRADRFARKGVRLLTWAPRRGYAVLSQPSTPPASARPARDGVSH